MGLLLPKNKPNQAIWRQKNEGRIMMISHTHRLRRILIIGLSIADLIRSADPSNLLNIVLLYYTTTKYCKAKISMCYITWGLFIQNALDDWLIFSPFSSYQWKKTFSSFLCNTITISQTTLGYRYEKFENCMKLHALYYQ